MRLPLGILTGVGFIGGGAILRRRDVVMGVTTAATLWHVTVLGLCFGGGQILLGWLATVVGALKVLWVVKWLEAAMVADFRARLTVTIEPSGPTVTDIRGYLQASALKVKTIAASIDGPHRTYAYEVIERRLPSEAAVPVVVDTLASQAGVRGISWQPIG